MKKQTHWLNESFAETMEGIDKIMGVHLPVAIKKGKNLLLKGVTTTGANSYSSTDNYGSYHGNYKTCEHDGSKLVFEAEGKKLYGSSWHGLKEYSGNWDLIIDLASNVRPPSVLSTFVKPVSTKKFRALDKFVNSAVVPDIPSEVLALDWNDMGVPPVTYDFWVKLWEMLPGTTVVACMGGHGRTGTCLAALAIIGLGLDYEAAIEVVRKNHCNKAVESLKQEQYLCDLYIEDLSRRLTSAEQIGDTKLAEELRADLADAIKNRPTATTTTGSKTSWGAVQKSWAIQSNEWSAETVTINGNIYIKECQNDKCDVWRCEERSHQLWILPKDSIYPLGSTKADDKLIEDQQNM